MGIIPILNNYTDSLNKKPNAIKLEHGKKIPYFIYMRKAVNKQHGLYYLDGHSVPLNSGFGMWCNNENDALETLKNMNITLNESQLTLF